MVRHCSRFGIGLVWGLAIGLVLDVPAAFAQSQPPEWKHGLALRVRMAGKPNFDPDTPKFGCEFYIDKNTKHGLYISEAGSITIIPSGATAGTETKTPKWLHGLELRVRKAGEADFTDQTKRVGIEVFKDENSGCLIYISDTGAVATLKAGAEAPAAEAKRPTWLHGLELKVRQAGEGDFNGKKVKKFGLEVFRDENNGNLVYICENGVIAVVSGAGVATTRETKAPLSLHGLEFRVRKAEDADFTKDTPIFGAEIFKDLNTNHLVYITENGSVAAVPAGTATGGKSEAPKWLHGFVLQVRKSGENDFTKTTKRVGGEIFKDENTGNTVFITETATIAVSTAK